MRQIVLDTETTGLEPGQGHRIIEIGCVEIVDRRVTGREYQQYLDPERGIDEGAARVHGITNERVAGQPRFAEVAQAFLDHVRGAELIIHNAPFDTGFLNAELARLGSEWGVITDHCRVTDTLEMARRMHPGQRNSLDALCQRYEVDNSHRDLHGAILDARILADVYLAMTGGQTTLALAGETESAGIGGAMQVRRLSAENRLPLPVLRATAEERAAHERYLEEIDRESGGNCLWLKPIAT